MKTILFCTEPYSFLILKPLADELENRGEEFIWYITPKLFDIFPYKQMMHTNSLKYLDEFKADAIFVPTDDVPYWLHGLKVHIFHSLVEDIEAYKEMMNYFDLYLTSGPHFTELFEEASQKNSSFDVIETGWSKLDTLFKIANDDNITWERNRLLAEYEVKHIVLYAPTSDLELTSATKLKDVIIKLSSRKDILFMIMFDKDMPEDIVEEYKEIDTPNILILEGDNISKNMHIADVMISDTSSLVYEFTLLDKPVLTVDTQLED
ncbi:MAG TPA: CDP-glycerol--glycerophosphate glycerophosphotransferase, partial [Campylobacterales bacterium]|nr:CDP-glycerol--glycerophosphate glycerophosphotransferase [Campylobacterales bacterium]